MIRRVEDRTAPLVVDATVGKHLALAPVAFAVIDAETHTVLYANNLFQRLQSAGQIRIGSGRDDGRRGSAADLAPLLEDAVRRRATIRDAMLAPPHDGAARWSASVWPVLDSADAPRQFVVEVRDVEMVEGAKQRQRAIAQELLLGALRAEDTAGDAVHASQRAQFLAKASRDLSLSLDEPMTRETMQRLSLPRPGTWCIVDVVESNGAIHRLAAIHPDPAKRALARQLEEQHPSGFDMASGDDTLPIGQPTVLTEASGPALVRAAHGEASLRILREIGFSSLLYIPLVVRSRVQGAITFVSAKGDPPFSPDEISLAADLGARCAIALDNARLYHEADALRLAAEEANRSKSQFLGMISHELRTPLNAIGGFAELLELGIKGPVNDQQRTALSRIKANEMQLLAMIDEILNFVRIESGRMEYHLSRVSLTDALADVRSMLTGAADEKQLKLAIAASDVEVAAWADPQKVRQILVNLLMNAVKYTPAGGTITLSCAVAGDTVVAHIADTGPGIESKRLESIFEPFVQLTTGLTDRQGGIGLGLPISRDLARAMKGDVTVESTVGTGSRFTLSLPRAPQRPAKVATAATAATAATTSGESKPQ